VIIEGERMKKNWKKRKYKL